MNTRKLKHKQLQKNVDNLKTSLARARRKAAILTENVPERAFPAVSASLELLSETEIVEIVCRRAAEGAAWEILLHFIKFDGNKAVRLSESVKKRFAESGIDAPNAPTFQK